MTPSPPGLTHNSKGVHMSTTAAIPDRGDDLEAPVKALLQSVALLGNDADQSTKSATPYSLQVIESGGLALSKLWATLIASVGGLSSLGALFAGFFSSQGPNRQMVLYGSAAVFLSATIIAVAIIVRSDVMARSHASSARLAARAQVVDAMINASASLCVPRASGTSELANVSLQLQAGPKAFRLSSETLEIELAEGAWAPVAKVIGGPKNSAHST
jgi:hypothetical protein